MPHKKVEYVVEITIYEQDHISFFGSKQAVRTTHQSTSVKYKKLKNLVFSCDRNDKFQQSISLLIMCEKREDRKGQL